MDTHDRIAEYVLAAIAMGEARKALRNVPKLRTV